MQLTITRVYPEPRVWNSEHGPKHFVSVDFSDGTKGSYMTNPDKSEALKAAFTELIGKPGEFEVTKERDYQGILERTFKSYPGQQKGGSFGGGGGKQWTPAFSQTKEGFLIEQTMMNARTSVMQGVANGTCKDWTPDQMMTWMQSKLQDAIKLVFPAPQQPERVNPYEASPNASPGHVEAENDTLTVLPVGRINNSGAQCQTCFAPDGKVHAKGCTA